MLRNRLRPTILLAILAALCWPALAQAPSSKSTVSPSIHLPQRAENADRYVRDLQFSELSAAVARMEPSAERDYFAGVVANREGRVAESVELLEKAIPRIRASNPLRAAVALHTLADDYIKLYAYDKAIGAYEELLHNFAAQLDEAERQSTRDDYGVALLLQGAPAQSITVNGAVDVPIHRNPVLGTIDADLTVKGVTGAWILDTGANFSVVSASFARRLGLAVSQGAAQTQGITGAENKLRVAILPELKLGGATVRNAVILVLEDSSLNVPSGPKSRYQINAVLGYPVLQALERITFTSDGHFLAGPDSPGSSQGARLFMNQLTPLLECKVEDRPVLFSFDTGANTSAFSARYHAAFPAQFRGLKKRPHGMGGAGGVRMFQAFYLPEAKLGIGSTVATLHHVPVLPPLGTDGDKVFGNLGRDLTGAYRRFTIDFGAMRFELGPKLKP